MHGRFPIVPNSDAPQLIELFLVAAVASVLAIRGYLAATGYPQFGGGDLHIAHMLWGGLAMMLALFLAFISLGHGALRVAALIGGVGFGVFIDELGKFITEDNDYFFQPTIGLLYIIFVAVFIYLRALRRRTLLTTDQALANALNRLETAGLGLSARERERVEQLLDRADPDHHLTQALRRFLEQAPQRDSAALAFYFSWRDNLQRWYRTLALLLWVRYVVIAVVAVSAVAQLVEAGLIAATDLSLDAGGGDVTLELLRLLAACAAAAMTTFGVWRMLRSRVAGYLWFQRAALVNLLITQLFAFFQTELGALTGLAVNLLIYLALSFMINAEMEDQEQPIRSTDIPATGATA